MLRLTADISDRTIDTYIGTNFDLHWCNNSKNTGFNRGGFDIHSDIITGQWRYGDDEALLKQGNGVFYGSYLQDPELQAVNVRLETIAGGLAFDSNIGVVETLDFDTSDIGSSSVLVVKVTPRRTLASPRINDIIITGE